MPTVNIAVSDVSATVIADLRQHWLDQAGAPVANVVGLIDGTTLSVDVVLSQAQLSSQQALPKVGQSVLIDGEPMVVTAANGNAATLSRGILPMATPVAHLGNAQVQILRYATPWEMVSSEALRPYVQNVISALGARSLTLGGQASGSVS